MTDQPTRAPDGVLVPTDECVGCGYMTAPVGDACPNCGITGRTHDMTLPTFNLVQPGSLAESLAALDVWSLDVITRGIGRRLSEAVSVAAQMARKQRERDMGGPEVKLGESDVAALVRRLGDTADVLERIGKGFIDAAKAARAEIAEEAQIVHPTPAPGYTTARAMVIPDGDTDIVAKEKVDRRNVWDDNMVAAVIAEDEAIKAMDYVEGADDGVLDVSYVDGIRDGVVRGITRARELLAKAEWKVTGLEALRKGLMARGDDTADRLAGILERSKTVVEKPTGEFSVTRTAGTRRGR